MTAASSEMWRTCPACGCIVGDIEAHIVWHGDLPPGQEARLRFGHHRDWPKTPGAPPAPAPPDEPPLEPPRSVQDVVLDPPPTDPTPGGDHA